jgi:type I restriction enzyme R subunit
MLDEREGEEELSSEDILDATVAARRTATNLSYFAFTATPKTKTLELFGRVPNPDEQPSKTNRPEAYHVYSMRQAIEEGFILDVLRNYTSYKVAYNLALKAQEADAEVDSKKAKVKLNRWVRLHDYNISQKVRVIVEHFKDNISGLLGGQAKAMVVTSSRKEAVRYKMGFDKYISEMGYDKVHAMVAFSGEVEFTESDPNVEGLLGEKFTETGMNPRLKGRDMRKAFDSDDYQVMIVANKFQTGFDQPKLCAMYVDKKLAGVECVQTLSRLNRTYPGKDVSGTYVLDFFNEPDDVLAAFQEYYQTAELVDVSNPNLVFDLSEKLRTFGIFTWSEVERFCEAFLKQTMGSGKAKDKQEEFLSQIIERLNEVFAGDGLTDGDMLNYVRTIKDKVRENPNVVMQIAKNTREQALLGDFPKAVEDAILSSGSAHQKQMVKLLSMSDKFGQLMNAVYDMMQSETNK